MSVSAVVVGLGAGRLRDAGAQGLTMQMSNGWSFSFSGNVNAFGVFSKVNNSGPANSSVRTGLLPAFATFGATGKEAGLIRGTLRVRRRRFRRRTHDQFGGGTGIQAARRSTCARCT